MFDAIFEGLAALLAFFYTLWPSYAGAIILLTLAVMLVLTPLSVKGTRSMLAMSRMAPEMKKLQQQYKDDREQLNAEMLKFYKENKINPVGGCLPLLLQLPVFIVLYQVLLGLSTVEERVVNGTTFTGPKHLDVTTNLYQDLADSIVTEADGGRTIEMVSWGMDLSQSLLRIMGDSIVDAIPFFIMVLAVAGTGWYQSKQIQSRNPNAVTPQQQMITRMMPIFFGVISVGIAGGVVLYFVVSNVVRIGQQGLVTRLEFREPKPEPKSRDAANGGDSSGTNDEAKPSTPPATPKPSTPTKEQDTNNARGGGAGGAARDPHARAQRKKRKKRKRKR